jgi:hypothetical protein
MIIANWHPIPCPAGVRMAFAAHLHGRDAQVDVQEGAHTWHWRVISPAGHVLCEGEAFDRDAAERAAEDEVCAVHPPSEHLLDELLAH